MYLLYSMFFFVLYFLFIFFFFCFFYFFFVILFFFLFFFFFFQAEDGIRDGTVTGVQTCALPIFLFLLRLGWLFRLLGLVGGLCLGLLRLLLRLFGLVLRLRLLDQLEDGHRDRKSTRLNSSHSSISYAVFCLKKKKTK